MGYGHSVTALAVQPNGQLASGSEDRSIRVSGLARGASARVF